MQRFVHRHWLASLLVGPACFVDGPRDAVIHACDAKVCSVHGHCRSGHCYCDAGFVGDPNAARGCQPAGSESPCATTCGLNSYCEAGECRCEPGFEAICGTGDCLQSDRLCDGTDDCANGTDEDPNVCFEGAIQQWVLVDGCDDGRDVQWRLWAQDRDWVWPSAEQTFYTDGLDLKSFENVECRVGELICFGAAAGERTWGVGLDGRLACQDCCELCDHDTVDIGALSCQ